MGEAGKADAQPSATTMVEVATSNKVIRSRCTPAATPAAPMAATVATTVARMAAAATAAAAAISAVQPLGQLGETTSPTAVPERSALPAETTTSGRRSVALAAAHVSAVRRGGAFPRRVQSNCARTSATASAILGVVQRFVADMRVPRAFRTDNGAEYTSSTFVEFCNSLRIRRELTAPYTPQQNGPVESGLSRVIKAGHAARIEATKLFLDVHLERLKGVRDPDRSSLWMESVFWASEGFNRSATTTNSCMLSPHEVFFRGRPPMPVLPFCKPAYHRVPWQSKMDRQARPCYFLNFGYNHESDCFKVMDAETRRIVHSHDVTWHQPREPLISPAPIVGSACPSHCPVPKRRTTFTFCRSLQPLLHLLPHRRLRQLTPHPRRYQTLPPQSPIALFGNWGTRPTCVCLVAREVKRAR